MKGIQFNKEKGGNSMNVTLELSSNAEETKARIVFAIEGETEYSHPEGIKAIRATRNLTIEEAEKLVKKMLELIESGKKFETEF